MHPDSRLDSIEQLVVVVAQLQAEVQRLRADNEQVRAENAVLRAENADLRRRLGMNSSKSSVPPSSDGLVRPRAQAGAKAGGRRRGKQPGASGLTLRLAEDPDRVVQHRPQRCAGLSCGADLGDGREYGRQRRQVLELPDRRPVVVEHQLISVECGECGQVSEPAVPAGVSGRVQYGTGVKAAAVYARAAQFLPFARVAGLLGDLLGVRVSTGFVHQMVAEAARRLGPFVSRTAALLHVQQVLHADETPARVGGGFKYVHVACTPELTLFHVGGRGKADIDAGGVLPGFTGTLVRDGYAAYRHLTDAEHAWCGAHLIRDLRGVHESDPAGQQWAEVMATTLLAAKKTTEQAVAAGRDSLSNDEISHLRACHAGALAYGREQNPPDRDGKLSRAGTLIERFATHRDMILRFTVDLAVPFTNNQAERDLRPVKLQQKISATWRTLQGLADFATLRSYLSTAAKHGKDALDVLKQLTTGPWLPEPATSS
ncbi:IS66 family transposase [Micromonospora craniellae]|uniref:IS66 family transposase n=1 Tax=Micromonospora craniellae TaxID=2294034 RepID=UPI00168A6FC6|nr:IS66 family transposase [Micromonospora craniellae]QOC91767.1 IS66 family transposase [Micromonospora craniellae]